MEKRQLLCRFSLKLFRALGSWGERKRRAREEKKGGGGGDSLGSWGRTKKAGEGGEKGGLSRYLGADEKSGRARKKREDSFGKWGGRKKQASEEKKVGDSW